MTKAKVAVVGAGILGSRHARVYSEQPDTELVAVVDIDPTRRPVAERHGSRFYPDLASALEQEQIELVSVATPDHLHCASVVTALKAGKHVLMEKPLATTLADARAIVAATAESGRVAMVNFSQRFVSDHLWIKQAVDAGQIGRPQIAITVKFDTVYVPTGMIPAWSAQTSPLYFMSSHDLDLIYWFVGKRPVEVFAHETRGTLDAQGFPVHDGLNALIQFEDGISTNIHSSWIHPNTYPKISDGTIQIIGSEGALLYNARTRTVELFNRRGGQKVEFTGPHTADEIGGKITGAFTDSVRHFLACVQEKREPQTSPRRALPIAQAQVAIIESLRTGQPVQLQKE